MANQKVSVLMSVFNNQRYLKDAIESILHQSFSDFEFLIIDDGSSDNSREIILSYKDSRIVFIENKRNRGLAESLNKGLELSKGKYIARMDADDFSYPLRLEKQISALELDSQIAVVGTHFEVIDENGKVFAKRQTPNDNVAAMRMLSSAQNPFAHGSVMFVKSYVLAIGGYNGQFKYAQDFELWSRLSKKYHFYIIEEPLYRLRSHPNLNEEKYMLQKLYRQHIALRCRDISFVPLPQEGDYRDTVNSKDAKFCRYYTRNYYLWVAKANIFRNPFYSFGCALKSFRAAMGLK